MKIGEKVKTMIQKWLNVCPAENRTFAIKEAMSFETSVIQNRIWYRGKAYELSQLYHQLYGSGFTDAGFWSSVPENKNIRKIHSGLPAILVDTISNIVKSDMWDVSFENKSHQAVWDEIKEDVDFDNVVGKAITETLIAGDGAFKISVDTELSQYPLIEFYSGENVSYLSRRGRIYGVDFWTDRKKGKKEYRLRERYERKDGNCYITYTLFDDEKEVPLNTIDELSDLKPAKIAGDYLLAVPLRFFDSPLFPGRGKSIFESKINTFDAHDEVISQWIDAIRSGRVEKYIPKNMIPTDPNTGVKCEVDSFGTNFIQVESTIKEGAIDKIETVQPEIKYDAFLHSYSSTLDMCLQGILSPATLGIDVGKMSSADAQREKKDVTGHTRNIITAVLEKALPELVRAVMMTYDNMKGNVPGIYEPSLTFGEYGAPDFDNRIESVSKAATSSIMSIESQVDELWGNSKDDEWKQQEVARIKQLKGIETMEEPKAGYELRDVEVTDVDSAGDSGDISKDRTAPDSVIEKEPDETQVMGE